MTDRLPEPIADGVAVVGERASATPARRFRRPSKAEPRSPAKSSVPRGLTEIETWMVGAITGDEATDLAESVFRPGPRQSARERFEVYRSGYRARLVECLEDDYPVLSRSLGAERFERLCSTYIDRHPSTSPNLNAFGRFMGVFCRTSEVLGSPVDAAFFSELAALEWAIVETIHAAGSPPLDAARLNALSPDAWGELRFQRSDAVRLLRFDYPVNAYYQAQRTGRDMPIPARAASATVVYRQGLTVWRMDLTPAMARVLGALLSKVPLGEALSRIGVDESDPAALAEAERSVMIWFREWVSGGLFSDFSAT